MAAEARRLGPGRGDVGDDAPDRLGAIEAALLAAQHLDPGHVVGDQGGEVELALEGIARFDAVDHHQGVVALAAADAHFGELAQRAAAVDGDSGHVAQQVGHDAGSAVVHLLGTDLGDRGAEAVGAHGLAPAGRDHQVIDGGDVVASGLILTPGQGRRQP